MRCAVIKDMKSTDLASQKLSDSYKSMYKHNVNTETDFIHFVSTQISI